MGDGCTLSRLEEVPWEGVMIMSANYRSMWQHLGLNLDAHDTLLGVLGKAYPDIFLSQKERPPRDGLF